MEMTSLQFSHPDDKTPATVVLEGEFVAHSGAEAGEVEKAFKNGGEIAAFECNFANGGLKIRVLVTGTPAPAAPQAPSTVPSAEDLDKVAEEKKAKDATAADAPPKPDTVQ